MYWLRRIGQWIIGCVVIICVAVVFDTIGKGILDSSDDAFIFSLAATVVATFLYRRHAVKAAGEPVRHGEVVTRAVVIGILLLLLTIPSKIRAIPDVSSEVSSVQEGVSSLQDSVEELTDRIDSIESQADFR